MCLRTGSNKKPCRRDIAVTFNNSKCAWSCLPKDLHYLILDKLLDPFDHLRFHVVCKEWYTAAKSYNLTTHRWHNKALPMLYIPSNIFLRPNPNFDRDPRLFSIFDNTVCKNVFLPSLELKYIDFHRVRKCGCPGSDGWFASITLSCEKIQLFNIFRQSMPPICLPRFRYSLLEDRCISSVTLSADPLLNPDSFVVIVVGGLGRMLALFKGGQTSWTRIEPKYHIQGEAIFYKDRVYLVRKDEGSIMSLDVNSMSLELEQVTPKLECSEIDDKQYLVKSAKGDFLWHVRRRRVWNDKIESAEYLYSLGIIRDEVRQYIDSFSVYKVMIDNKDNSVVKQVEVKSIGDEALFVGDNECYSILASSFPMCHKNFIYYTMDSDRSGEHYIFKQTSVCIFNLEDCTTTIRPAWINRAPIYWTIPPFKGLY